MAAALPGGGLRRGGGTENGGEVFGGPFDPFPPPADPPLPGLTVRHGLTTGLWAVGEMRFTALLDGQEVGKCEVALDLADNGALPALQQWAQLTELQVEEPWRNRGIGNWLGAQSCGGS